MKQIIWVILIICIPFCLIGALMAAAIIYEEFSHHFTDARKALWPAIETAIIVFLFFLILIIFTVLLLSRMY